MKWPCFQGWRERRHETGTAGDGLGTGAIRIERYLQQWSGKILSSRRPNGSGLSAVTIISLGSTDGSISRTAFLGSASAVTPSGCMALPTDQCRLVRFSEGLANHFCDRRFPGFETKKNINSENRKVDREELVLKEPLAVLGNNWRDRVHIKS